jgi:hypothetical protein
MMNPRVNLRHLGASRATGNSRSPQVYSASAEWRDRIGLQADMPVRISIARRPQKPEPLPRRRRTWSIHPIARTDS